MKTRTATLFVLSMSMLTLTGGAGAQPPQAGASVPGPLVLKTTIPLPRARGRMDHMSVDLPGRRVFLSEIGNGGVEAIYLPGGQRRQRPELLVFEVR